jgi:hypothetical protein
VERLSLFAACLLAGCTAASQAPNMVALTQPADVDAFQVVTSRFSLTAIGNLQGTPEPIDPTVMGLQLDVRTGDHPRIAAFDVPLGDLDVSAAAFPPHGLKLRKLDLHIDRPADLTVMHAQDDAIELQATTPLTLSWALALDDGSTWTLGPMRTQPIQLDVTVLRDPAGYAATVSARCDGDCWTLDGIGTLRDAQLELQAQAEVTPGH